jgi:hypothetical protein
VGFHAARSINNDLLVVSAIADAAVPPRAVLGVAHDAAAWVLSPPDTRRVAPRSLFELRLGDSEWATITESPTTDGRRSESVDAVLPAWSAQTRLDVGNIASTGVRAALDAMVILLAQPVPIDADAVQVARAAYTRLGFEAAAVSAMDFAPTGMPPSNAPGVHRHALLRFAHPYAVVAVAVDGGLHAPGGAASPWHGVPVFSAWVTTPDDPDG